ncbi:MAG: thiamine phosphate synthase [Acidobacteriota bacterium]
MNQQRPPSPILPTRHPLVYLITDRLAFHHPPDHQSTAIDVQLRAIDAAVNAGCQLIQIRERGLDRVQLSAFVSAVIEVARPRGGMVFVNHDIDVAIGSGADGVHLRVASLRPREARQLAIEKGRSDLLIGVSTHTIKEATEAASDSDFIVCGPIYETKSKREFGPPIGLRTFEEVVRGVRVPVLGIGGIDLENFREVLACGAAGVAGIGLFSSPETAAANVRTILG